MRWSHAMEARVSACRPGRRFVRARLLVLARTLRPGCTCNPNPKKPRPLWHASLSCAARPFLAHADSRHARILAFRCPSPSPSHHIIRASDAW